MRGRSFAAGSSSGETSRSGGVCGDELGGRALHPAQGTRDQLTSSIAKVQSFTGGRFFLSRHCLAAGMEPNGSAKTPSHGQVAVQPGLGTPIPNRYADPPAKMILGVAGDEHAMNSPLGSPIVNGLGLGGR